MKTIASRTDPCPCGSGKKYKRCCVVKQGNRKWVWIAGSIVVGVLMVGGTVVALRDRAVPPEGKIWSEEHGHWHDPPVQGVPGAPAPSATPPPGKVWSVEHGHWHDLPESP